MENDLRMLPAEFLCILYCTLCHITEKCLVRIVASALGNLKDNWRFQFCGSLDDSLELLHVVEVESRNSVSAFDSLCKHFSGVYKAQFFIRNHFL